MGAHQSGSLARADPRAAGLEPLGRQQVLGQCPPLGAGVRSPGQVRRADCRLREQSGRAGAAEDTGDSELAGYNDSSQLRSAHNAGPETRAWLRSQAARSRPSAARGSHSLAGRRRLRADLWSAHARHDTCRRRPATLAGGHWRPLDGARGLARRRVPSAGTATGRQDPLVPRVAWPPRTPYVQALETRAPAAGH